LLTSIENLATPDLVIVFQRIEGSSLCASASITELRFRFTAG